MTLDELLDSEAEHLEWKAAGIETLHSGQQEAIDRVRARAAALRAHATRIREAWVQFPGDDYARGWAECWKALNEPPA